MQSSTSLAAQFMPSNAYEESTAFLRNLSEAGFKGVTGYGNITQPIPFTGSSVAFYLLRAATRRIDAKAELVATDAQGVVHSAVATDPDEKADRLQIIFSKDFAKPPVNSIWLEIDNIKREIEACLPTEKERVPAMGGDYLVDLKPTKSGFHLDNFIEFIKNNDEAMREDNSLIVPYYPFPTPDAQVKSTNGDHYYGCGPHYVAQYCYDTLKVAMPGKLPVVKLKLDPKLAQALVEALGIGLEKGRRYS